MQGRLQVWISRCFIVLGQLGDIRIRGNCSLTVDNNPLYVIDGIPMSAGSIADVNPSHIESMEILRLVPLLLVIYGSCWC